ncbi:hypothetical protein OHU45_36180 [Streptomyces tubercidicus]|uniref:hypothetical protein n=1 Tax=Streptomyces tubercidicus TaxID=47759 RepID=UPI002E0DB867|nr:hypothetical protein OG761_36155 [Streptomyces tubercidicus]WSX18559.1 hypothetical protein OG690_01205 [Streptomyces tubercidicus]
MRRRILRAVVVAVVCAVMLFAVPLAVATLRLFQRDELHELQQLADRVAVTVPADVHHPRDPVELPRERGCSCLPLVLTTRRAWWFSGVAISPQGRVCSFHSTSFLSSGVGGRLDCQWSGLPS